MNVTPTFNRSLKKRKIRCISLFVDENLCPDMIYELILFKQCDKIQ